MDLVLCAKWHQAMKEYEAFVQELEREKSPYYTEARLACDDGWCKWMDYAEKIRFY